MKKNQLLIVGGIAVLLVIALIFFSSLGGKKTPSGQPGGRVVPPAEVNPTEAALKAESRRVINEGGQVPYDYIVASVSDSEVRLDVEQGGGLTLSNVPLVKVFKRVGTSDTPAAFSDLKVGQKLVLERAVPPSKELSVFIVSE